MSSKIEVALQRKPPRKKLFFAPNPNGNRSRSIKWKSSSCESGNFKTGMKPALQCNKAPFGPGMWVKRLGGTTQSVSVYQRFHGEKCKQFSWIGFPSKPEPQEAVKIELGEVGVEGWRGGGLHLPHSRQLNRNWLPPPD